MSITRENELKGMMAISEIVARTLREMREFARPGMSADELDEFGGAILNKSGARSAPRETYGFPGWTCISINHEIAHGIPSQHKMLREGDLINIDVSAELNGYWSDNGGSFVLGRDIHNHNRLVSASRRVLYEALKNIRHGVRISEIGKVMEQKAGEFGYRVIRDLAGHGIGRSLHEAPYEILNWEDRSNRQVLKRNSVIAVETFISTKSWLSHTAKDGWTLTGNAGGYTAQHEHTIVVTDRFPLVLTRSNGI